MTTVASETLAALQLSEQTRGRRWDRIPVLEQVLPLALGIIFLILYFQFKSVITTSLVFSGILIAWAGGFIMLWLYGQPWFMDFAMFDDNMRTLFQVHPINLSVAVWVGFIALFGVAVLNGLVWVSGPEHLRVDGMAPIDVTPGVLESSPVGV